MQRDILEQHRMHKNDKGIKQKHNHEFKPKNFK